MSEADWREQLVVRRRFLNWMLGTGAGALSASILYPVARFLVPPEVEESDESQVTLPMAPRDIGRNSGQIFRFGSKPGIIVRTPDGELRAFDGMCTHLDCIVQYRDDISRIWCACHNGHYDLNGTNIEGPPPRPLQQYSVVEQGDKIVVSKDV
jgi:cytochrome b6-f complex iron-sulfur subunit